MGKDNRRAWRKGKRDDRAKPVVSMSTNSSAGITTNYLSFSTTDPKPSSSRQLTLDSLGETQTKNSHSSEYEDDTSQSSAAPRWNTEAVHQIQYRGFSSSIIDMFSKVENERVDCCSLTCCGFLQSDRDRFLLTGVTPPGPIKRFTVHVLLPILIFFCAGLGATHIQDPYLNQLVVFSLVFLIIAFMVLQCYKGRSKRITVRKDLLYTKYQIQNDRRSSLAELLDQERPLDEEENPPYYLGQTRGDFLGAHPCCLLGCYSDDRNGFDHVEDRDDNMCSCLWKWFSPSICGMHLQCCGSCALGQEGREVERSLLPPSYRRIDYITMQAYMEYYPVIYQRKYSALLDSTEQPPIPLCTRLFPLSQLSIRLLLWLTLLFTLVLTWAFVGPLYWKYVVQGHVKHRTFELEDFFVFLFTFIGSIGLLLLMAFWVNRPKQSYLSADAMIKYFAAGFCLSTSLAIFWEVVFGLLIRSLLLLGLTLSGVDVMADPQTSYNSNRNLAVLLPQYFSLIEADAGQDFLQAAGRHHPIWYTLYIFVATFILAAFIEELCKYFGYRMIEHPDFLSQRELDDAWQVYQAGRDHVGDEPEDDKHTEMDFTHQLSSFQSHGAAVTLAMLCVAMGFTCCENLVYVFVYSGDSARNEVFVLMARSLFPVHPISAAIQSLGVVERDVENNRSAKLGRSILLPAILFHGAYDFFIVWIDFMAQNSSSQNAASIISFLVSLGLMLSACIYYAIAARRQRKRLAAMDRRVAVDRSKLI